MKKVNTSYLAIWAGIPVAVAVVLVVLAFTVLMGNKTAFVIAVFVAVGISVAIPMFLERRILRRRALLTSTNLRPTTRYITSTRAAGWAWSTATTPLSFSSWI